MLEAVKDTNPSFRDERIGERETVQEVWSIFRTIQKIETILETKDCGHDFDCAFVHVGGNALVDFLKTEDICIDNLSLHSIYGLLTLAKFASSNPPLFGNILVKNELKSRDIHPRSREAFVEICCQIFPSVGEFEDITRDSVLAKLDEAMGVSPRTGIVSSNSKPEDYQEVLFTLPDSRNHDNEIESLYMDVDSFVRIVGPTIYSLALEKVSAEVCGDAAVVELFAERTSREVLLKNLTALYWAFSIKNEIGNKIGITEGPVTANYTAFSCQGALFFGANHTPCTGQYEDEAFGEW